MKRSLTRAALVVAVVAVALAGAGLWWARPAWAPAWAQLRGSTLPGVTGNAIDQKHSVLENESRNETDVVLAPDDGWCGPHGQPGETCSECLKQGSLGESSRQPLPMIQLSSTATAKEIGLASAKATAHKHVDLVTGNAEVAYNAHRYAEVHPRVAGFIREVRTEEGDHVEKGDVLVVIDSAEVGSAKAAYLAAIPTEHAASITYQRTERLVKQDAMALKDEIDTRSLYNKAKADLLNAKQKLHNLGFNDADLTEFVKKEETSSLLSIRAPIEGMVMVRHADPASGVETWHAVEGEAVVATTQLFVVTNIHVMWLFIDIYESQIDQVKIGQPVSFTVTGSTHPPFLGKVELIDSEVHPSTRTIRVRAEIGNPDGWLKANQFGLAQIEVSGEHVATLVPREAVQRASRVDVVFFPEADGRSFRPQRVVAKATDRPDWVEIEWGVHPGQTVVTTGSFLLKSELLNDELGAANCQ
ncbi:MAG: efflux RND transporter periplasmic adaptor subunit [Isosphaeraceae bacterium]